MTKTQLVEDLMQVPQKNELVDEIIRNARRGLYHDFESPLAMPKAQLVEDLTAAGVIGVAEKVMAGDYDE